MQSKRFIIQTRCTASQLDINPKTQLATRGGPLQEIEQARRHLKNANLAGKAQENLRSRILQWLDEHDDALYRTCLKGHLTGSAVIIDPTRPATLLIHHKKLKMWLQPGGHADGQGDLAQVALREATEETGLTSLKVLSPAIDLDIHTIPERGDEPEHLHLDVRFLVIAPAGSVASPDEMETMGAIWVSQDDPDGLIASDELRRLIDRAFFVASAL